MTENGELVICGFLFIAGEWGNLARINLAKISLLCGVCGDDVSELNLGIGNWFLGLVILALQFGESRSRGGHSLHIGITVTVAVLLGKLTMVWAILST